MRYQIGQKVPFIHFTVKGQYVREDMNHMVFTLPIPWENTIAATAIRHMVCVEHHKVPWDQDPDGDIKYDGFVFDDQQGHKWYNQYPRASYGQLTDTADGRIHIHPNEGETFDSLDKNKVVMVMQDLARYLSELLMSVHQVTKNKDSNRANQLVQLYNQVVQQYEQATSNKVVKTPFTHEGREIPGLFHINFE